MHRHWRYFISFILLAVMSGCVRQAATGERKVTTSSSEEAQMLLNRVKEINLGSADSYTANFTGDAIMKKKKFNFLGEAVFNKNPRMMKYTFLDTVFKSIMTVLVQDGDNLKIYFPVDKSLLLDNVRNIRLRNYLDIDADFNTLYPLAVGQIPLIPNYTIKSGLVSKAGDGPGGGQRYIILENDEYFETISFIENNPDKILLINKLSKQKIEIYLEKPAPLGKSVFFKTARLILFPSGDKLTIAFRDIRFNTPIDPGAIQNLNLEKGTKFIQMEK